MCDMGIGIGLAGLALSAAGTAATVYSQYQQQDAQNKANEYNAKVLERNAENAKLKAQYVVDQGAVDEAAQRQKVRQFIGSQRAAASANGLLVDSGTPADLTSDTAGFGELDALTIRNNARRTAWGIENQSADYNAQANLSRMKNGSPIMAAAPSLLSGGSQLAGQLYSNYKTSGNVWGYKPQSVQ